MITLILLLLLPQYVRKPFHDLRIHAGQKPAWKDIYYEIPVTFDKKGEAVIRYESLYPGNRYTQACQPDERTRDKNVRFFPVEEDAEHIRIGTEPRKPGMKVLYVCTVQVAAKDLERSTQ